MLWLLLLGLLLLVGGLFAARLFVAAQPQTLVFALKTTGVVLGVVVLGYLALTGRLGWLFAALPLLLPLLLRWYARHRPAAPIDVGGETASSRRDSQVRTRFLQMSLDHATGELDGEILAGARTGERLSNLALSALVELLAAYDRDDPPSARLLEAYLDRRDPDWREVYGEADSSDGEGDSGADAPQPDAGPGAPMTREDALRVLGLVAGASDAEIRAAHLRMIAAVHPDRGGSSFLAAQVNRARDILLGEGH